MKQVKKAFTLAEALIAMAIIGVVAALTVPNLMKNINERDWDTSSSTFNRKFGEAIRIMNTQSGLTGYNSTKEFVNELSKYIKIVKICDSDKLSDCFANKLIKDEKDKSSLAMSDLTNADIAKAGYKEVIGVQFSNGINALISYNPYTEYKEDDNVLKFKEETKDNLKLLKIAGGFDTVAVVYDTNGFEKPNTLEKDIKSINSVLSAGSAECTPIGDGKYCIWDVGMAYQSISCSNSLQGVGDFDKYCGSYSNSRTDYWAGANKLCKTNGMELPTRTEIGILYDLKDAKISGIPTSGLYWTFEVRNSGYAYALDFSNGSINTYSGTSKSYDQVNVLCIK